MAHDHNRKFTRPSRVGGLPVLWKNSGKTPLLAASPRVFAFWHFAEDRRVLEEVVRPISFSLPHLAWVLHDCGGLSLYHQTKIEEYIPSASAFKGQPLPLNCHVLALGLSRHRLLYIEADSEIRMRDPGEMHGLACESLYNQIVASFGCDTYISGDLSRFSYLGDGLYSQIDERLPCPWQWVTYDMGDRYPREPEELRMYGFV